MNTGTVPGLPACRVSSVAVRAEHDADGLRSSAIMRLLLTNAYRCRDMLGAQIEDLGEDRGHRTLGTTVKGGHRVKDAIPPPTARAIDVYLASRGGPTSGPIFATRTGRPMDNGGLAKLLRRLCLQAGVPVISPHGGRKTAITEALVTVGLRGAQDLAHHADPRTTRIYDAARGELDDHPAYVLATRYGVLPQDHLRRGPGQQRAWAAQNAAGSPSRGRAELPDRSCPCLDRHPSAPIHIGGSACVLPDLLHHSA